MTGSVKTRQVYYIPGYDPFPPRRYRELYRSEAAAQAAISGYDVELSPMQKSDHFGWRVSAKIENAEVETEIRVLEWSDIVQDSMARSILGTYVQLAQTAWVYIATGALWRLMQLRIGPVIAALYPIVFLLVQALLALLVLLAVRSAALTVFDRLGWSGSAMPWVALALGFGAGWAVLSLFKRYDAKFFAYYLMHDYAHGAATRGAIDPALDARLTSFRMVLAEALKGEADEVLLVGHSSGAHLGVTVLADLIRDGSVPKGGPALSFLSLGQVVPMVSFLPQAHRLRGDLQYLSERDELIWVDITAPGDGCAFALCDPVAVSGVATDAQKWPVLFSAAFTQTLSPERWQHLKRRYFRLHFQYLCAFDRPKDYDYFRVTAGPKTLGERYGGRASSKSRIARAVSKFTSIAS